MKGVQGDHEAAENSKRQILGWPDACPPPPIGISGAGSALVSSKETFPLGFFLERFWNRYSIFFNF